MRFDGVDISHRINVNMTTAMLRENFDLTSDHAVLRGLHFSGMLVCKKMAIYVWNWRGRESWSCEWDQISYLAQLRVVFSVLVEWVKYVPKYSYFVLFSLLKKSTSSLINWLAFFSDNLNTTTKPQLEINADIIWD